MSKLLTIKVEQPSADEIWAPCATCRGETAHTPLTKVATHDQSPDGEIEVWCDYFIIQCGGCKTVSFCRDSACSEDTDFEPDKGWVLATTRDVFPSRVAGRPLMDDVYSLPYGVGKIYNETHQSISNNQSILTGIGLRAIVEAVCKDKETTSSTLHDKINELSSLGVLTPEGASTLHSIRLLGNNAAHEAKANSQEELFAAFEVVEHLLRSVYVIPHKASRLNKSS